MLTKQKAKKKKNREKLVYKSLLKKRKAKQETDSALRQTNKLQREILKLSTPKTKLLKVKQELELKKAEELKEKNKEIA
jgi:hypothetical protein